MGTVDKMLITEFQSVKYKKGTLRLFEKKSEQRNQKYHIHSIPNNTKKHTTIGNLFTKIYGCRSDHFCLTQISIKTRKK